MRAENTTEDKQAIGETQERGNDVFVNLCMETLYFIRMQKHAEQLIYDSIIGNSTMFKPGGILFNDKIK